MPISTAALRVRRMGADSAVVGCGAVRQVHEEEFDVFDFLLALGHGRCQKGQPLTVARDGELIDVQRSAGDGDGSWRGAGILFCLGSLFGAESGVAGEGFVDI